MTNEEYAAAYQGGRHELIYDLWLQTERFIGQQAGKYLALLGNSRGVTEEDLKQSGFLALAAAAEDYKPDRGASFLHYLTFHLHRAFVDAAGLTTERQKRDPISSPVSIDKEIDNDHNTLADIVQDPRNMIEEAEQRLYTEQLHGKLEEELRRLPEDQAAVVRARFFEGKTAREVAATTGEPVEDIRRRQAKALEALRRRSDAIARHLDGTTSFYWHTGVGAFQRTHTSAVEEIVFHREAIRQRMERRT